MQQVVGGFSKLPPPFFSAACHRRAQFRFLLEGNLANFTIGYSVRLIKERLIFRFFPFFFSFSYRSQNPPFVAATRKPYVARDNGMLSAYVSAVAAAAAAALLRNPINFSQD